MSDNELLMIITAIILVIISSITVIMVYRRAQTKKFKRIVDNLDTEKNNIVGVPILSEIAKVRDLVKTDNLRMKLDEWDTTFKLIKDDNVPKVTDLITEADFLIDKHDYNSVIKKIANIEMEIGALKHKAKILLDEIKIITNSEERNRSIVTKLKVQYRELQSKFERTRKDYDEVEESLEKRFETIEKRFQDFENAMEQNDYVLVEKIVVNLEELVDGMKVLLDELPSLVLMDRIMIPKRIEETSIMYARMIRDGYPLDYLNVEYNVKEISNKLSTIFDNMKLLELGDSSIELKTILEYFDNLFKDFDKEKMSKDVFSQNCKAFKSKLEKINKVIYDVYLSIDDIKFTYDLKDEEIAKFDLISKNLEKINDDFKLLLEHSKGKNFAYSKLVEELDGLNNKLLRVQDDLDYQLKSITSMKDDEYRAREELDNIQKLLKASRSKLKDYKLPIIPNSYFVELKETNEAIREITKELEKKPIVIKILNIRVDTARDLVFKVYNNTNKLLKTALTAEQVIIYGNRYRSNNPELDKALDNATDLFNRGIYDNSLSISTTAIEKIENGILDRINEEVMKKIKSD